MVNIKGNFFGGITAAIIALPLALAFGVASGAGAIAGLYGAIILGFFASFFGGTASQISGPTGPMTVVFASAVVFFRNDLNAIMGIVFLAGIFQIIFGILKIGRYVKYIPYPVISGFMSGIGIIIIILQINPFMGLESQSSIIQTLYLLPNTLQNINPQAFFLAILSLFIMFLTPKKIALIIPTPLIALILATSISVFFDFHIKTIGDIPLEIPKLIIPSFSIEKAKDIIVLALTLALLGSIDTLLTSLVADSVTKTKHNSNKELIGQGIGNSLLSFVGGLPGAGATMRTVINIKSGGTSKLSGMIHSISLLLIVLFFAPIASNIPLCVLAGILMKVGVDILDYKFLRIIKNAPKHDLIIMIIVFLLTVFVDLIIAVGAGITLASLLIVYRISKQAQINISSVNLKNKQVETENFRVLNIDGAFFFGSASFFEEEISKVLDTKKIIINCINVPFIDISAIFALEEMILRLRKLDIKIALVLKANHITKIKNVDKVKVLEEVKFYTNLDEAYYDFDKD